MSEGAWTDGRRAAVSGGYAGETTLERRGSAHRKLVALAAVAGLLAGCRSSVNPAPKPAQSPKPAESPTPVSSPTRAPVDGVVGFHIQTGTGQSFTLRSPQAGSCPGFDALLTLGHDRYLRLSAYAASCDATGNTAPGNGRHGGYRSVADIPADRLASSIKVHTAIGDAVAFTQRYYECTNSCHNYTEPVAVITLDHPQDPGFPALMVYSERGTISLDQLEAVLRDQLLP
jgi:hypothetical protein